MKDRVRDYVCDRPFTSLTFTAVLAGVLASFILRWA